MSDEQQEQTQSFEEVLLNRLAQRLGVATAQVEALTIQLEMAQARVKQLEEQASVDEPLSYATQNGEHSTIPA